MFSGGFAIFRALRWTQWGSVSPTAPLLQLFGHIIHFFWVLRSPIVRHMIHSDSSSFDLRQTGNASAKTALLSNYLNPAAEIHGLNHTHYPPAILFLGKSRKQTCPTGVSRHISLHINSLSPWGSQVGPGAAGAPRAVVLGSLISLPQSVILISPCSTCAMKWKEPGKYCPKAQAARKTVRVQTHKQWITLNL